MQRIRYRSTGYYSIHLPPGIKWLLIVNVAVFLLEFATGADLQSRPWSFVTLVPDQLLHGFLWQLATYMFVHGGVWHIVINMLMLWMFGVDLERDWGTRRFLKYYFLCGIGAGLSILGMALFLPPAMSVPTVGASGAIFGLLLAYGVVYADRIILLMLLFPMKAKYAVLIFGAIEFFSLGEGSAVSHIDFPACFRVSAGNISPVNARWMVPGANLFDGQAAGVNWLRKLNAALLANKACSGFKQR